jgi:hypothetical protein
MVILDTVVAKQFFHASNFEGPFPYIRINVRKGTKAKSVLYLRKRWTPNAKTAGLWLLPSQKWPASKHTTRSVYS